MIGCPALVVDPQFQSAPGSKARRNRAESNGHDLAGSCFNPLLARRPGETVRTAPKGRPLDSCFNPLLARRPGETQDWPSAVGSTMFQSAPGSKARRNGGDDGFWMAAERFQSAPGSKARRNPLSDILGGLFDLVSIRSWLEGQEKRKGTKDCVRQALFQSAPGSKARRNLRRPVEYRRPGAAFQSAPGSKARRNTAIPPGTSRTSPVSIRSWLEGQEKRRSGSASPPGTRVSIRSWLEGQEKLA